MIIVVVVAVAVTACIILCGGIEVDGCDTSTILLPLEEENETTDVGVPHSIHGSDREVSELLSCFLNSNAYCVIILLNVSNCHNYYRCLNQCFH